MQKYDGLDRNSKDKRLEIMKRQAMVEASVRIQQMADEGGFSVDKKEISKIDSDKEDLNSIKSDERKVVYIDKNELKDNPQNILNIENSVVYISSSSRAASPSPSQEDHGQGPPSLGTQSLKSQDDHVNKMLVYNLKKYNTI